jgi:hypothetical protein
MRAEPHRLPWFSKNISGWKNPEFNKINIQDSLMPNIWRRDPSKLLGKTGREAAGKEYKGGANLAPIPGKP